MGNIFLIKRMVKFTYDFDVVGGGGGTGGTFKLGVIPDNAIIISAFYDVITAIDSGAQTDNVELKIEGSNDLVAAGQRDQNIWDTTGVKGTLANNFSLDGGVLSAITMAANRTASYIKTSAARDVSFVVPTSDLTAGKFHLYIKYIVSE